MTEALPIACSLSAGDLKQRLSAIAEIGKESLIDHATEDGRQVLRFRSDPGTHKRLEEIVAAESECCSFLDLALEERDGELILSITAPEDGQAVADELVAAFAGGVGVSGGEQSSGRATLLGGGAAALAALCCFAGPAILGAIAGATIGSTLGIVAAVVCAAAVAVVVALLLRRRQGKGATGC